MSDSFLASAAARAADAQLAMPKNARRLSSGHSSSAGFLAVDYAARTLQSRWRLLRNSLPYLLECLRTIATTEPEKLEPLRRRPSEGVPGVLTVAAGEQPGSLRGFARRPVPSYATFAAFSEAVGAYDKARAPEPSEISNESAAWQQLSKLLEERAVVGVMGGYHPPAPMEAYFELGVELACAGYHVLTGGGGSLAGGPVTSVVAGFTSVANREGRTIGIVPDRKLGQDEGVNPFNDTLIYTNLPAGHKLVNSRNHLNVLLADVIVALSGGPGTLHEIELAIGYSRAVVTDAYWQRLASVPDATPALPTDGSFGFLAMPKFWVEAAAAGSEGGGGGGSEAGLRLTADGRSVRDDIAGMLARADPGPAGSTSRRQSSFESAADAMPFVSRHVARARGDIRRMSRTLSARRVTSDL
tara:strand:- start:807 stop:2048 length:1242 start_codon:yes stop_codon:yes gene_type:complete